MPKDYKAQRSKQTAAQPALSIPKGGLQSDPDSTGTTSPVSPKTPADEGIEFFQSPIKQGETPIRVYELPLDPDGGPNHDRSVSCSVSFKF